MPKTKKRPSVRKRLKSPKLPKKSAKSGKKATNLTLDPEAVARGERFSRLHGTSVSQLVTRFLYSLPAAVDADTGLSLANLMPVVQRLYGVAAGGTADRATYREYLFEKYRG
jgi:hypothetical protein